MMNGRMKMSGRGTRAAESLSGRKMHFGAGRIRRGSVWILALLLVLGMLGLSGCGSAGTPAGSEGAGTEPAAEEQSAEEENYDTGDASLDDPLNQDGIGEKEILVVSFGTSFNDSRRLTIGGIEQAIIRAFPDWSVRRAFTSQIIIDHVAKRDGVKIDNVQEALERASANGVKELVVQPTHLMNGLEYNDLEQEIAQYADAFEKVSIGKPLLTDEADFTAVGNIIMEITAEYDTDDTAVVYMGHGTEADSNAVYGQLQEVLNAAGQENYFIGTVEAKPGLEDVMSAIRGGSYSRVVLRPLMVVAGDHANNDMAGDGEDSWKSTLEKAGYEVECVLEGLGQVPAIQDLYVSHAAAAMQPAE